VYAEECHFLTFLLPQATGTILSSEPHFDVALEYSIGLHSDLISMDMLDVLHFEHADKFTMREQDAMNAVVLGSLLVGSHTGKWYVGIPEQMF